MILDLIHMNLTFDLSGYLIGVFYMPIRYGQLTY